MTSKTSLSKKSKNFSANLSEKTIHKGLFLSDLKRFWWVSALYTITLLLILPVYHLLQGTSEEKLWIWENILDALKLAPINSEFQLILIYFVPVFLAVLLFMYLHSGKATATIHSLPVTRRELFFTHCGAGILLLAIPVIITGLTLIVMRQLPLIGDFYSLVNVLSWMGYTLLFGILFFAVAVFVGMFTGNPITQAVFTFILFALPLGLYELFRYNLSQLLFGYSNAYLHQGFMDSLPIYAPISNYVGGGQFTTGHIVGTLILTLVIFAIGLFAYRARKLEAAGDVVTFSIIRPIFKYGVTVCTMLLIGAYFASISDGSMSIIFFGYLLGSLLGYYVAEVLLQKSLRIWSQGYKGYLGYTLLLVVALFAIQGDVFGFVHKVPAPGEVEEVFFGPSAYAWVEANNKSSDNDLGDAAEQEYQGMGIWSFKEPQNIENVIRLHSQIVLEEASEGDSSQFIIYALKDGKTLIRQYNIDQGKFSCLLKPIYESTEYKEARFPVLSQTPNEIKMIEINDFRAQKEPLILADDTEISEFTHALKQDLKNLTFQEMGIDKYNGAQILITNMKDQTMDYSLRYSYSATLQWLNEKGYLEQAILQPEEIDYVVLTDPNQQIDSELAQVEIRDTKLIQELLEKTGSTNYSNVEEEIAVHFYVKTNHGVYEFQEVIFKNASVSPELKQYLDQVS